MNTSKVLLVTFIILVTIPMSMSQSEEENDLVSESWGSTDITNSKLLYTWSISNFKFHYQKADDTLLSPTFSGNDGCKWYMEYRLKGPDDDNEEYFALYLYSVNCNSTVTFTFSILNAAGEQANKRTTLHKFESGKNWGFNTFILRPFLLKATNNLLPDNKLTITCEIVTKVVTENSFTQPKRHLVRDLGILFANQDLADVTLRARGSKFKAHKAILSARSPVLKARFEEDGGKRKDTVVEVTDLDPKALGELLRYIYTEEVLNLEVIAPNLLAAAENYKLAGLKTLCENILLSNLSVENAVDFLILGNKYSAIELKNDAKKFIIAHASDVANTTEFKSLILTHPQLFVETFDLVG